MNQQQARAATSGVSDRPGQRPPARPRAADAHDHARDPPGFAVHRAASPAARYISSAVLVILDVRPPGCGEVGLLSPCPQAVRAIRNAYGVIHARSTST